MSHPFSIPYGKEETITPFAVIELYTVVPLAGCMGYIILAAALKHLQFIPHLNRSHAYNVLWFVEDRLLYISRTPSGANLSHGRA